VISWLWNKLKVERAFKLMYTFTNLLLLDRDSTGMICERFLAWESLQRSWKAGQTTQTSSQKAAAAPIASRQQYSSIRADTIVQQPC